MSNHQDKAVLDGNINLICNRLEKLDSAAVSDVFDAMGLKNQILSTDIFPLYPGIKLAGPAFCIRGLTTAGSPASVKKPNLAFEVDRAMYPGCVAVIETGGHREGAIIGGNVGLSYKNHGCRGAVIDGGVRDAMELAEIDFRTFASSTSPMSSKGRWAFVQYEVPIAMPGHYAHSVLINPGDLILADSEGILVIPRNIADYVVNAAEEVVRIEQIRFNELKQGHDREEVYARNDTCGHIKPLGS